MTNNELAEYTTDCPECGSDMPAAIVQRPRTTCACGHGEVHPSAAPKDSDEYKEWKSKRDYLKLHMGEMMRLARLMDKEFGLGEIE